MDANGRYSFGKRSGLNVILKMNPIYESELMMTRRQLFGRAALGLGTAALANVLGPDLFANAKGQEPGTHFAPNGVYHWIIKASGFDTDAQEFRGFVHLMR